MGHQADRVPKGRLNLAQDAVLGYDGCLTSPEGTAGTGRNAPPVVLSPPPEPFVAS
jgi:hypothetical protein